MCELENQIQKDLVEAMKKKEERKIAAIRSIKAAIQNEKTSGVYHEVNDTTVLALIQKLAKQRAESIEVYKQAGRNELAENEEAELEFLNVYLPKMLTEEELKTIISEFIISENVTTMKDMGKIMAALKEIYPNQYDGKIASTIIKKSLLSL